MSTVEISAPRSTKSPASVVDTKLEVVVIPVADVDRAKRFYGALGWRLDADFAAGSDWRVVQLTPPGSPCSIHFGKGVTTAPPGSAQLYLVVDDIEAARAQLIADGAQVSELFHLGNDWRPAPGADPERASYRSLASFKDPDGNGWLLQEVKERLPGRGMSHDVDTLTGLLKEAEIHHGQYEPTAPKHHWSAWYAAYVIARERGDTPEEAVRQAVNNVEGDRR